MNNDQIKLFTEEYDFIEKDDCDFLIKWIDNNFENENLFRKRIGVAHGEGAAYRAVFPDEKPATLFKDLEIWTDKYSEKFKKLVKENYEIENPFFYGVSITKLTEGIQLRIHKDIHNTYSNLTYSCVAVLNDDYEGGEMVFVDNEIDLVRDQEMQHFPLPKEWMDSLKVTPKSGGAVLFKADQLHGGEKITSGNRYAVIFWIVAEEENKFKGFDSDFVHK